MVPGRAQIQDSLYQDQGDRGMASLIRSGLLAGILALASGSVFAQQPGKDKGEPIPPPKGPNPCEAPVCVGTCKACIAVPEPKTKTVYGCREIDFCVPGCGSLFSGHHRCESSPNCEAQVRTKRVLLTKVCPECPGTKWVVEERVRESCPSTGCTSPGHRLFPWLNGSHSHADRGANVLPAEPAPAPGTPPSPLPKASRSWNMTKP